MAHDEAIIVRENGEEETYHAVELKDNGWVEATEGEGSRRTILLSPSQIDYINPV